MNTQQRRRYLICISKERQETDKRKWRSSEEEVQEGEITIEFTEQFTKLLIHAISCHLHTILLCSSQSPCLNGPKHRRTKELSQSQTVGIQLSSLEYYWSMESDRDWTRPQRSLNVMLRY
jgi:hypothetical protein